MRRLVPYPLLTLALVGMWLLLNRISMGHLLLGTGIALIVSQAMRALQPERLGIRWTWAIPKLAFIVLADIVRSNIAVGRIVIFNTRDRRSGFILLPLDMRNRYGLVTLAVIITATPGTLWVQHDAKRNLLLIHVLDFVDEEEWIALIKHRYEQLLMEIFE